MRINSNDKIKLGKLLTQPDRDRRDVAMFAAAYAVVVYKAIPKDDEYLNIKTITSKICELAILDRVKVENYIKNISSYFNMGEATEKEGKLQGETLEEILFINRYIGSEMIALVNANIALFREIVYTFQNVIKSEEQGI